MTEKSASSAGRTRQPKAFQDKEIEKVLVSGEEVLLRARLHGALFWKPIAVLLLAICLGVIIPVLGMLLAVVGGLMFIVAILTQHFLLLAVTNKRVLARYGLLQMDVVDIRLSKIESIDLERMLPGQIFGYASVVVMGTGQRLIRVPYIGNADNFRRFYNEIVLSEEGGGDLDDDSRISKAVEGRGESSE